MPQLDASTFATQIFWCFVAFAVLYSLMKNRAIPAIERVLEARAERLRGDLDKAAQLRAEAEAAMAEHEALMAKARTDAQARANATRERMNQEQAQRLAALEEKLRVKTAESERAIAAARDQALASLDQVAVEASSAAAARLLGAEVGEEDARAALAQIKAEAA